jgi:two-component system, OmpR family, response regulator QseB
MRLLIVEDDPLISNGIEVGLALGGAAVDRVDTCADAQAALQTAHFDAIVLDLMLPDGSGLALLRNIRAQGDRTPVLVLTALDDVSERIKGLDAGADDYLGKPFDLEELSARLRAIARRGEGRAAACMNFGEISLDPACFAASKEGKPLDLSRREFAVLAALMERPGTIWSKSQIEDRLYGWQEEIESNAIEVHIHNLRAKLGRDTIETVRGLGYRVKSRSR